MAKASTKSIAKPDYDWETEDDLRTMMRAEEIEKDPKRLARLRALAKTKMLEMAALASESKKD